MSFRRHISLRDCCRTSFLFCLLSGNYFVSLRIHEKSCCVNITYLQFNEQIPKLMPCLTQRGYIRKRQHGTCATNTPQKFSIASQNSKDRKAMMFNWNHDFWEIHSWECLGKSSLFFVDWLVLGERPTKFGGNVNWSQTHTRRLWKWRGCVQPIIVPSYSPYYFGHLFSLKVEVATSGESFRTIFFFVVTNRYEKLGENLT